MPRRYKNPSPAQLRSAAAASDRNPSESESMTDAHRLREAEEEYERMDAPRGHKKHDEGDYMRTQHGVSVRHIGRVRRSDVWDQEEWDEEAYDKGDLDYTDEAGEFEGLFDSYDNPRMRRNFFWGGSEKTERTVEKEAEGLLRERYGQPWYDLGLPRNWFYSYKLWDRTAKDLNESQLQQMYADIDARRAEEEAERAEWEIESQRRAAEQKIRDAAELSAARAARSAEEVAADEAFNASLVGKPASYVYKARGDRVRRLGRKWNPSRSKFSAGEPYSDQDGREIFPVYKGTTLFKKYYKAENRDRWLARRARDK
jgi:hypothetical protein